MNSILRAVTLCRTIAVVGCLAASATVLDAQAPVGSEFLIFSPPGLSNIQPMRGKSTAMSANGSFVVVWEDEDDAYMGVAGQLFDPAGGKIGTDFRINTYSTDDQRQVTVAMDPAGQFMVVWRSRYQDGSEYGAFGQRYDALGGAVGQEFQVNTYTTGRQIPTAVAADASGTFIVVWAGAGPGDPSGVFARRYHPSGAPVGSEIRINTYTTGQQNDASVALDGAGNAVVVWTRFPGDSDGSTSVYGQRISAAGSRIGVEFHVNAYTTGFQGTPMVASHPSGSFLVAWSSDGQDGSGQGIYARRYDASGTPEGPEFRVNSFTTFSQGYPSVSMAPDGRFVVVWGGGGPGGDVDGGIFGRKFDAAGLPRGDDFQVNTHTPMLQLSPSVSMDGAGNFVVTWLDHPAIKGQRFGGLAPSALDVDTSGNHVLEPGDTVNVRPTWWNGNDLPQTLTATLPNIIGPTGATYTITDGTGDYGSIPVNSNGPCIDCFEITVSSPMTRPAFHWDAVATESLSIPGVGKSWRLHVGATFADVPPTSTYYPFIETLVHHGATVGCSPSAQRADFYCPQRTITRAEVTPFLLVARQGAAYAPPPCVAPGMFVDVPVTNSFCPWIEELARRGVVDACAPGKYCPRTGVAREEVAVFVLKTLDPSASPPQCVPPNLFADVPENSPYCPWIEELANRGGTVGCGGGNFCPTGTVTRAEIATFLTVTFALTLYGP